MNAKAETDTFYDKHYAHLKLPEKRVAGLKDVIFQALKDGTKPKVAVKKWAIKKGVDLGTSDAESVEPAVKEGGTNPGHMDRKSIKATLNVLRDAGVRVKFDKEDGTDVLAGKLSSALNGLPSPEMMEKLDRIDPQKLKVMAGDGGCLGLFIDVSQPECQVCEDRDECVKKYISNLKGDLKMFKNAMVDLKTDAAAKQVTEEEVESVKKNAKKEAAKKDKKSKRIKYDAAMTIYVMDIENPVNKKKEPEAYDMVADILKEVPSTLGKLRKLTNKHFQYDDDRDYMEELFTQCRDLGIIKLREELDDDQIENEQEDEDEDEDE